MDLTTKLVGIVRSISGKIRADEDVPKSDAVLVHLNVDFSDCTIEDVLKFACADRKIAWAASGRKTIGKLTNGQRIDIKASSPGAKAPLSAMEQLSINAKASGRTIMEQFEFERKASGL